LVAGQVRRVCYSRALARPCGVQVRAGAGGEELVEGSGLDVDKGGTTGGMA
jgi:hypothetical protein